MKTVGAKATKTAQVDINLAAIVAAGYVIKSDGDPIKSKTAAGGWAFDWLLQHVARNACHGHTELNSERMWVAVVLRAGQDRLVRGAFRRAFVDEIMTRQSLEY